MGWMGSQLDRYVRFSNLLMNDTTYLLSDAIEHLGKINELQKAMDDKVAWEARPLVERQEQEKLLRQYEGTVKSDLDLGHESLRLLKLFTSETKEPFLTPEIVDRLAAMLDMNLNMLAGPRCQDLKVRDPEKYKFRPKELLSDVLQIYLELGPRAEFQEAVAKDGRSYSVDLFERAEKIARKLAIKTDEELGVIREMVVKVEAIKTAEEEDDAMGEVPDEFLGESHFLILPSSRSVLTAER
jgi:ubiquitin conjugation factor E4 B